MTVSKNAELIHRVELDDFLLLLLFVFLVHLSFLAMNFALFAKLLPTPEKELRSLVIAGSQKTFPVAVGTLELLPLSIIPHPGMVAVPMLLLQLMQTLIDSLLAAKWSADDREGVPALIDSVEIELHAPLRPSELDQS